MGRPKLPDQVKAKRGTLRPCRAQGTVATKVSLLDVQAPAHLKGEAKKVYELKVRQCFAMGILAEIDADALALYAWEYAELIALQRRLKSEDYVIEEATKNGTTTKINPLAKIVQAKLATVNALGSQFGWSPLTRMRLQAIAKGEDEKDDFNELLNG
jgi:P27 family predicted phage terminase small subunit